MLTWKRTQHDQILWDRETALVQRQGLQLRDGGQAQGSVPRELHTVQRQAANAGEELPHVLRVAGIQCLQQQRGGNAGESWAEAGLQSWNLCRACWHTFGTMAVMLLHTALRHCLHTCTRARSLMTAACTAALPTDLQQAASKVLVAIVSLQRACQSQHSMGLSPAIALLNQPCQVAGSDTDNAMMGTKPTPLAHQVHP